MERLELYRTILENINNERWIPRPLLPESDGSGDGTVACCVWYERRLLKRGIPLSEVLKIPEKQAKYP